MKRVIIFLLALNIFPLLAQQKEMSIYLRSRVSQATRDNQNLDLIVKGDVEKIKMFVAANGGIFKYGSGDIAAVSLPAGTVESLLNQSFIKNTEFSHTPGQPLNDTMLINNRVDSVHAGLGKLTQGYDGKGVVVGIIDTGIDFSHPDFKDSTSKTRIKFIWDQPKPFDSTRTPQPYNYGQEWSSADIDSGICTHDDPANFYGHGTNVSGTAAGNGLALNKYRGVAPEADIVVVASDFSKANWTASIADAVNYIFNKADSMGKPCAINISLGTYLGSHDGRDLAAQLIDSMISAKPGRAVVAAAGNAGHIPFHLGYDVTAEENFTWFKYNASSALGYGAVYFQLWADTNNFKNVRFSVGADKISPDYSFRGKTPFDSITSRLNQLVTDTLYSVDGNRLAIVDTWAEIKDGNYFMEVHLKQPDSSQYNFRFITKGSGRFDVWSATWLGHSAMVTSGLPDTVTFPDIAWYKAPDTDQTIVSSWNCSPKVISVANYNNRYWYWDYNNIQRVRDSTLVVGAIFGTSSKGPARTGIIKPDIAATGNNTMSTGRQATIALFITTADVIKVGQGGMHTIGGGTSMAAPVVTGVAALYLQKNPGADHSEIKVVLLGTAREDGFTGPAPNNTWGYGKINALKALESTDSNIVVPSDNSICIGDSAVLSAPQGYSSYLWSNNLTTASITVNEAGTYSLIITDTSGLQVVASAISVTMDSLPNTPLITQQIDTLFSTPAFAYQWYLNDIPLSGADSSFIKVMANGIYMVEITDTNGCSALSEPFEFNTLSIKENAANLLRVYPNPGSGMVNAEYYSASSSKKTAQVTDIAGKEIITKEATGAGFHKFLFDLSSFPAGVYLLKIQDEKEVMVKKIIRY